MVAHKKAEWQSMRTAIAKAYGKTQAFQEMWAAIGRAGSLSENLTSKV